MVAVDCGLRPENVTQYKFAKVLKSTDLKQHGAKALSRQYRLNEGQEEPVMRRHLDIFKFLRGALRGKGAAIVPSESADGTPEVDLGDEDGSDWKKLIEQLHEMESLVEEQYRKALHRLFLQWHPDKCDRPHAAHFFNVLRRHETSFRKGKDFTWLEHATDAEAALEAAESAGDAEPTAEPDDFGDYDDGPDPNSWFAQFEHEKRSADHIQKQAAINRSLWEEAPASPPSGPFRRHDEELSDYYWQGAHNSTRVAGVLAAVKEWPDAVWKAQQAVELTVKALMLRTCGITEKELRGKGAHDLTNLMCLVASDDRTVWPAPPEDVEHLSSAYLKARYPTSEPTDRRYHEDDAARALGTAEKVIAWARDTHHLNPPDGEEDEEEPQKAPRQPKKTVLDPAPPPPGPAAPVPTITAPRPAEVADTAPPVLSAPPPPALEPLWQPRERLEQNSLAVEDMSVEDMDDDDGAAADDPDGGWGGM